ncbi:hypothetical protein N7497_004950 [Penicillium chrysogenum]|nr:hypothetical protein N7497_004950 [Penicillium chrysogenum]
MNASGMTKRNVVLGSAVMQLCDLSLPSILTQPNKHLPCRNAPNAFTLALPLGLASMHGLVGHGLQPQDTPIIVICNKHPRLRPRGRKMSDRTQGIGDMR